MTIRVKLFAKARDVAGTEALAVRLAPGTTVADLRQALCAACPELKSLSGGLLVAVNAKYAGDATRISAGDEVACFPPVSGG